MTAEQSRVQKLATILFRGDQAAFGAIVTADSSRRSVTIRWKDGHQDLRATMKWREFVGDEMANDPESLKFGDKVVGKTIKLTVALSPKRIGRD